MDLGRIVRAAACSVLLGDNQAQPDCSLLLLVLISYLSPVTVFSRSILILKCSYADYN